METGVGPRSKKDIPLRTQIKGWEEIGVRKLALHTHAGADRPLQQYLQAVFWATLEPWTHWQQACQRKYKHTWSKKTWRCSEKEAGLVRVIIIIISVFLLERGEGGGGGSCTRAGAVQNAGSRKAFFFYLGHARSDGGSGDEDHVGRKLSRPEDLQRLWRRDGETCYWGRTIGKKMNISIHSGGQLISEWRRFCHI